MNLNKRASTVVLGLVLAIGAPACSGESEVCADVDALRADLDELTAIEIQPGALADFSAAFDAVEADVDRLLESAASEFENEIDAVQSATQALAASVESAAQAPSGPAVTQLSADFGAFTSATESLIGAVEGTC
jgi:hypothetical protein